MNTYTVTEMLARNPCPKYTQDYLTELWAGRERVSDLNILDMDIPDADKVWGTVTTEDAEVIVTRAIINFALNCGIKSVEKWAREWLDGTDRSAEAAAGAAEAAWAAEEAAAETAAEAARAA